MGGRIAVVVVGVLILATGPGRAQTSSAPLDAHLRVEWEVGPDKRGRTTMSGYVLNSWGQYARNVRLQAEALDTSGQAVGKTLVYVNGDVPPLGRTYFIAPAPPGGTTYRFILLSADWRIGGL